MSIKVSKNCSTAEELIKFTPADEKSKNALITEEALSRRQVHIIDEVTDSSFEQIKNLYDQLVEDDINKPIHFVIGTAGGDARSMLGIMNLMLLSQTPCYTYLLNETCSAGSWIYLCGSKRFAPKTNLVSFMLHPIAWDSDSESLGNHNSYSKYVERLSRKLIEFTAERTKLPITKLRRLATNEMQFFIGEEIFEQGIATDELTTSTFWLTPDIKKETKKRKVKESKPKLLLE